MGDVSTQNHFESGQTVIAQRTSDENLILFTQIVDCDVIVQDDRPEELRTKCKQTADDSGAGLWVYNHALSLSSPNVNLLKMKTVAK